MRNFRLFQQARCEVIVKYTNCNLLEHERIRTGIKTLEAQIDEKNKNIKARQNVTGSYKRKRVYFKQGSSITAETAYQCKKSVQITVNKKITRISITS